MFSLTHLRQSSVRHYVRHDIHSLQLPLDTLHPAPVSVALASSQHRNPPIHLLVSSECRSFGDQQPGLAEPF